MLRRFRVPIGITLALGFAALALVSGLDRMSSARPELAASVPAFFRVYAARASAEAYLAAGNPEAALPQAALAVRHDPIDARSISLLGSAHFALDDADGAQAAFTVAGKLGWREPLTQIYWMSVALGQGDYRVAAQRLDAILRQAPALVQRNDLLAELEASPQGRSELARQIVDAPIWRIPYFGEGYLLDRAAVARRAAVAENLSHDFGVRDCELVARLTKVQAALGDFAGARHVWRDHCLAPGADPLLGDGGFESASLTAQQTAFDWSWSDDGAIGIQLAPVAGFSGRALTVTTTGFGIRAFATRITVLPPGSYRARWRALTAVGEPASGITLSVACDAAARETRAATLIEPRTGRFEAGFAIPQDCPAQWLTFSIAPGSDMATLDDVAVQRQ